MSSDKLATIRNLLDTAESYAQNGNADAAETYRNKAMALMAKHGVEEAMLSARTHRDEAPITREVELPKPYAVDKGGLLYRVARALGVRAVRITGAYPRSILVGFESDIERVELLYTSLLVQAFGELGTLDPGPYNRTSFNKAWLLGFSVRVGQRLQEAEARARGEYDAENGGPGAALVIRDRAQRVSAAYAEQFPGAKSSRRKVGNGVGYLRGKEAGERADIGAKHVRNRRPELV